jgi:hypothetical protein
MNETFEQSSCGSLIVNLNVGKVLVTLIDSEIALASEAIRYNLPQYITLQIFMGSNFEGILLSIRLRITTPTCSIASFIRAASRFVWKF